MSYGPRLFLIALGWACMLKLMASKSSLEADQVLGDGGGNPSDGGGPLIDRPST